MRLDSTLSASITSTESGTSSCSAALVYSSITANTFLNTADVLGFSRMGLISHKVTEGSEHTFSSTLIGQKGWI